MEMAFFGPLPNYKQLKHCVLTLWFKDSGGTTLKVRELQKCSSLFCYQKQVKTGAESTFKIEITQSTEIDCVIFYYIFLFINLPPIIFQ